jgi:hypothetical protein
MKTIDNNIYDGQAQQNLVTLHIIDRLWPTKFQP